MKRYFGIILILSFFYWVYINYAPYEVEDVQNEIPIAHFSPIKEQIDRYVSRPLLFEGQVVSSLSIKFLGGFYILKGTDDRRLFCITPMITPAAGTKVKVYGMPKILLRMGGASNIVIATINYEIKQQ